MTVKHVGMMAGGTGLTPMLQAESEGLSCRVWGSFGIMEKQMETAIMGYIWIIGYIIYWGYIGRMEKQMGTTI